MRILTLPAALAAFALALATAGCATAQEACPTAAAYRVKPVDGDTFHVEADFTSPTSRLDLFYFPIADRPQGQAESIRNVHAYGDDGQPVELTYVGEGGWETQSGEAVSRLTYEVRADHDAADWNQGGPGMDEVATRFDDSYFFAGHAFFLIDYDAPACPVTVEFDVPQDWNIVAPWEMDGRTARAANPWNLGQNAFVMGPAKPSQAVLSGLTINMLISSGADEIADGISGILGSVPQTYMDFFGGAPGDRYSVFVFTDTMSDGGAFQNSFAMRIATPFSPADEIVWSHTLGHEVMHLWIGAGAIHSTDPESTYWFTEGFTDYLTIKLMYQSGHLDEAMLKQRLANILRRYEIAKRRTPDATLAEAGANKQENWELVYGGGSLVALLLDATVSAEHPGMFRDMMRDLYEHSGTAYTPESLIARMDASTGGEASRIVDWVNSRPDANAIRQRLLPLGLDSARFGFDEVYVDFAECGEADCVPAFLAKPEPD
ncbi:MAG: hypothetical protein KDA53_03870 [Hyphomonas sp.]|nr:hypothetical protein [Hyphomonas sp.]